MKMENCRFCGDYRKLTIIEKSGLFQIQCEACCTTGPKANALADAKDLWNNLNKVVTDVYFVHEAGGCRGGYSFTDAERARMHQAHLEPYRYGTETSVTRISLDNPGILCNLEKIDKMIKSGTTIYYATAQTKPTFQVLSFCQCDDYKSLNELDGPKKFDWMQGGLDALGMIKYYFTISPGEYPEVKSAKLLLQFKEDMYEMQSYAAQALAEKKVIDFFKTNPELEKYVKMEFINKG